MKCGGRATEGVELEYEVPVRVGGESYESVVHLLVQPVGYDVYEISGEAVQLYPN